MIRGAYASTVEDAWETPFWPMCRSLMTPLGIVEGEVLEYLERHQTATLRQLTRTLASPSYMVMMAVGALTRAGIVRATQRDLEIVVKSRTPLQDLSEADQEGVR